LWYTDLLLKLSLVTFYEAIKYKKSFPSVSFSFYRKHQIGNKDYFFLLIEQRPFPISEQEIIIPKKKCTDVTSVPSHSLVYPGLTVI
jgi:hypothetical protein